MLSILLKTLIKQRIQVEQAMNVLPYTLSFYTDVGNPLFLWVTLFFCLLINNDLRHECVDDITHTHERLSIMGVMKSRISLRLCNRALNFHKWTPLALHASMRNRTFYLRLSLFTNVCGQ